MGTLLGLTVANVKSLARDRAALFWTIFFPIMFVFLFGWIFGGNGDTKISVGLVDQDGLRRGRGRVDAQDQAHGGQPAERPVDQMAWLTMFSSSSWRPETGCGSISPDSTFAARSARVRLPSRMPVPSSSFQPA